MPTNYFAELEKLTEKELEIINDAGREDMLRLFHKPSAVLSIEMHKVLCGLRTKVEYYPVSSETEISPFAGIIYGGNPDAQNVLLTELSMSEAVRNILKISQYSRPSRKRAETKKPRVTENKTASEPGKQKSDAAGKETEKKPVKMEYIKAKYRTTDKKELEAETRPEEKKQKRSSRKEESPYGSETDWKLFHNFCSLPVDTKDRENTIDEIARIFCSSKSAEDAVCNVEKRYEKETADAIRKEAVVLMRSTRGGISKPAETNQNNHQKE